MHIPLFLRDEEGVSSFSIPSATSALSSLSTAIDDVPGTTSPSAFSTSTSSAMSTSEPTPLSLLNTSTPEQTEQHIGSRNYIGVIVVAVLVAVALILYIAFAKSSKRFRQFCRRKPRNRHSTLLTNGTASSSTVALNDRQDTRSGSKLLTPGGTDGQDTPPASPSDTEKGFGSSSQSVNTQQPTTGAPKSFLQKLGLRKS